MLYGFGELTGFFRLTEFLQDECSLCLAEDGHVLLLFCQLTDVSLEHFVLGYIADCHVAQVEFIRNE